MSVWVVGHREWVGCTGQWDSVGSMDKVQGGGWHGDGGQQVSVVRWLHMWVACMTSEGDAWCGMAGPGGMRGLGTAGAWRVVVAMVRSCIAVMVGVSSNSALSLKPERRDRHDTRHECLHHVTN